MKVLLVRAGALGDLLLLRRAVASLRSRGHSVSLLAPSAPGGALIGLGPSEADALLAFERAEVASLLSEGSSHPEGPLAERLASFDAAIAYTRSGPLLTSLARLVGRVIPHDPQPRAVHASRWLALPLRELGVAIEERVPDLEPLPGERAEARRLAADLPDRFLAIHPGSGSTIKNWPASRFAELAKARSERRPWLLILGPAEASALAGWRPPRAVVARCLPIRILGALLARAGLYVGNDSGVTHLAAAYGAPTVALFGSTDSSLWSPVGHRVLVLRGAEGRIEAIGLSEVHEAGDTLMREPCPAFRD